MPNMLQMQKDAEVQIRSWGNNKKGQIVRDGSVRKYAFMALSEYKPTERGLFLDGSVRILVSAVGLSEIDFEQDTIVFLSKNYKLNIPVTGARPDGTIVLFDCNAIQISSPASSS